MTTRSAVGAVVGYSSIFFWILCQLPQLVKNCKLGSAKSLSAWFLGEWLLGDALNLWGALLTNQSPAQIATAVWFVFVDSIMISQKAYLDATRPSFRNASIRVSRSSSSSGVSPSTALLVACVACMYLPSIANASSYGPTEPLGTSWYVSDDFGTYLGWGSAIVYLNSRLPQIYKNYRRQSVDGLSALMFVNAVLGNLTYGVGAFLSAETSEEIVAALPWLVGSLGTLSLDFVILLQFRWYSSGTQLRDGARASSTTTTPNYATLPTLEEEHDDVPRGFGGLAHYFNTPFFGPTSTNATALEENPLVLHRTSSS